MQQTFLTFPGYTMSGMLCSYVHNNKEVEKFPSVIPSPDDEIQKIYLFAFYSIWK